ncbi:MAG: hypothetical protein ACT4NY_21380 [Pseudonocardiales bacterium]
MTQQTFGSELPRLREQRGLSLKKFAKLLRLRPGQGRRLHRDHACLGG